MRLCFDIFNLKSVHDKVPHSFIPIPYSCTVHCLGHFRVNSKSGDESIVRVTIFCNFLNYKIIWQRNKKVTQENLMPKIKFHFMQAKISIYLRFHQRICHPLTHQLLRLRGTSFHPVIACPFQD